MTEYPNKPPLSIAENPILGIFYDRLPRKPYCSDNAALFGLYIRSKNTAIKRPQIQFNPPWCKAWLAYDIDTGDADTVWMDKNAPMPNMIAINPDNGHGHVYFGLKTPVLTQRAAHLAPLRYAAAVDIALTALLGSDPGFAGLIGKNPLHPRWRTIFLRNELYELDELAEHLDLGEYKHKSDIKDLPGIGLGRNCSLFDIVRFWAYRNVPRMMATKSWPFIADKCIDYARENNNFDCPLPDSECKSIGTSVAKWVTRNMSPQSAREWHTMKAKKGRKNAQDKAQKRLGYAMIAAYEGKNRTEIANELGVSVVTVDKMRLEYADPRKAAVIAFKATHPDASCRIIAAATGVPKSNVASTYSRRKKTY